MYCPACGSENNQGRNFCNSCGMRMFDDTADLKKTIARNFSIAIGFVGTFGLVGFVLMIKAFLENGISPGSILAFALMYLAAFFGLCYFLISGIMKAVEPGGSRFETTNTNRELSEANRPELNEYQRPASSVVEYTTKSLDEVLVKRQSGDLT